MTTRYATRAELDELRSAMTQSEIAAALGISIRTVQGWMRGRGRMYYALYLYLAAISRKNSANPTA